MRTGYKIVADIGNKTNAMSLYGGKQFKISLKKGKTVKYVNGLYLGTSKKFVTDYYSGLSDYPDLLLTYEYSDADVMSGDPESSSGEVKVSKAILIDVERLEECVSKAAAFLKLNEAKNSLTDLDYLELYDMSIAELMQYSKEELISAIIDRSKELYQFENGTSSKPADYSRWKKPNVSTANSKRDLVTELGNILSDSYYAEPKYLSKDETMSKAQEFLRVVEGKYLSGHGLGIHQKLAQKEKEEWRSKGEERKSAYFKAKEEWHRSNPGERFTEADAYEICKKLGFDFRQLRAYGAGAYSD